MAYDDQIGLSETYQSGFLIKPVDGVGKNPQYKGRERKKKSREHTTDEVVISQDALDAVDETIESQNDDRSQLDVKSQDGEISAKIDIHV